MFISPMLCNSLKIPELKSFDHSDYLVEPKYDGIRAIVSICEGEVKIYSRTGKEITHHLPYLVDQLAHIPSGTVLDGEIMLVDRYENIFGTSVAFSDFNKTMRVMGSLPDRARSLQCEYGLLSFVFYDVLYYRDTDTALLPLSERKQIAQDMPTSSHVVLSPLWDDVDPAYAFNKITQLSGEGVVIKNRHKSYMPGKRPVKNFYKIKAALEADVVIMGFKPGEKRFTGLVGSIIFGRWDGNKLSYIGRCSGMTDSERAWITEHQDQLIGTVMTISYNDVIGSKEYKSPRHPQFVCLREDKKATDCTGYEFACGA